MTSHDCNKSDLSYSGLHSDLIFNLNSFSPDDRGGGGLFLQGVRKLLLQMQENIFFIPSLNVDSSHQVVNHDSTTQPFIMH